MIISDECLGLLLKNCTWHLQWREMVGSQAVCATADCIND